MVALSVSTHVGLPPWGNRTEMIGELARVQALAPAAMLAWLICWGLLVLLRPWLARHVAAIPNSRSSHHNPTPQGAGIAVAFATLAVTWTSLALIPALHEQSAYLLGLTAAVALLATVGAIDDIRPLPALPRFLVQVAAVGIVIMSLPQQLHVLPFLPWWIERGLLFIGVVWFVNLVNFMDGIDWMTVAETVPVTGAIIVIGLGGENEPLPTLAAAALFGAMLGFAPFNKPVAKLFLGDAGSLPIGLILAWLLIVLAGRGHLAAAVLLPLYYLADATITMAWRIANRERVWEANRCHFYQVATARGFSVANVIAVVLAANTGLAGLAVLTVLVHRPLVSAGALMGGAAIVGSTLWAFAHGRRKTTTAFMP
jgi:UDP-N-acetylmuramyl pentapeptide phosphotransferase/UDP-N-acetylglucosamine-1-phosphate transferase